jgi:hypothetical protein
VPFTVPVKLQPPLRRNGQGRSRLPLPVRSGLEIRQCDLLSARWVISLFFLCFLRFLHHFFMVASLLRLYYFVSSSDVRVSFIFHSLVMPIKWNGMRGANKIRVQRNKGNDWIASCIFLVNFVRSLCLLYEQKKRKNTTVRTLWVKCSIKKSDDIKFESNFTKCLTKRKSNTLQYFYHNMQLCTLWKRINWKQQVLPSVCDVMNQLHFVKKPLPLLSRYFCLFSFDDVERKWISSSTN